jgi:hypothetical protein
MRQRPLLVRGLSVLCAALISTSSWAATTVTVVTVNPSKGSVLINRGNGYTEIKRPTKVRAGTNVMVGPDGAAIIAYADGCSVKVAPGSVETVASLSPCASGSYAQNPDYGFRWCTTPPNPNDYNNPSYCAGVPVTAAVLALFGTILIKESVSP